MTTTYQIQADRLPGILPTFIAARRTPVLIGKPGIAKTEMVRRTAATLSAIHGIPFAVRELHLASMSEVDVRGYLIPNGENAVFTKPEFWPAVEASSHGILFLDEFAQASHEVQKAVAPLLLERRIGEYHLPEGWTVIAAGNGLDDGAGANSLLTHIVNRVTLVHVSAPDPDSWVLWGQEAGLPFEVLAFAKFRPNVVFDSDIPAAADTPYCTPRSLHAAGDLANAFPGGLKAMINDPAGMAILSGTIGQGPASELSSVVRTAINLPSYESVVRDPEGTEIPAEMDQRYAMVMLLAVRAKVQDADPVVRYLTRMNPNFAVTGIVSLVKRDRGFASSKAMLGWIDGNRALLAKFSGYITNAVK